MTLGKSLQRSRPRNASTGLLEATLKTGPIKTKMETTSLIKVNRSLMPTTLDTLMQKLGREPNNPIIKTLRCHSIWNINTQTTLLGSKSNTKVPLHLGASVSCLLLILLALFGCDSPEKDRLEQMRFLVDTKKISEQYTSKLKQRLAENAIRTKELQGRYQSAQASHNRLLGKLKLAISNAKKMSEITLQDTTLISNVSSYLRYVDALDQSTADEKGFLTSFVKSGGSAFLSLLTKREKPATRTDLIEFIDSELMWVAWDDL